MSRATSGASSSGSGFRIEGNVRLEGADHEARYVRLKAYAFDRGGNLLAESEIDSEGKVFLEVGPTEGDVEYVVSGAEEASAARETAVYSRVIKSSEWVKNVFSREIFLEPAIWNPLRRRRFCISGHVRKVTTTNGTSDTCPVSYVKVEVFDVDREWCWWPYLRRWWELLDPRVIRIAEIIRERIPIPFPGPDPGPIRVAEKLQGRSLLSMTKAVGFENSVSDRMLNPQPLPPRMAAHWEAPGSAQMFNPQPDPPHDPLQMRHAANMGFLSTVSSGIVERLREATLTSRLAPWLIFRRCFYSRQEICETYTDCDGYFRCCFRWFPWHFRRGHFRFDPYPDIILKITQSIGGVDTVIYTDPYTNTRWNATNAHIDLYLDDEDIVCSSGCGGVLQGTSQAAILQVGADPVWTIDQADGKYQTGVPNYSNGAYQKSLTIKGDFTPDLRTGPTRYYKLSYCKLADYLNFTPIQTPLSVLRAVFLGTFQPYLIGPQPSGPAAGLYEVQDLGHWWINPGPGGAGITLGTFETMGIELDEGGYYLRMEVFDQSGVKLNTIQFPNHGGNGSGIDPSPVPIMVGQQDLRLYIDNKPMSFDLTTPATNACGVVKWSPTLALSFHVHAEQENGRVHSWDLKYVKGIDPTRIALGSGEYAAGLSPVDVDVNGGAMLVEPVTPSNPTGQLQSTCAFALLLNAYLHCRGDWGWIYVGEKAYAIAVEKCPP